MKKNEERVRNGGRDGERGDKERERIYLKHDGQNFSNLMKNFNLCIQEDPQTTSRINVKRSTPKHIFLNCRKLKIKRDPESIKRKTSRYIQVFINKIELIFHQKS